MQPTTNNTPTTSVKNLPNLFTTNADFHCHPEMLSKINVLNFTMTVEGTVEVLLGMAMTPTVLEPCNMLSCCSH